MAKTDLAKFSRFRFRYFNRDADFVVLRPLRSAGRDLRPGDHFDKTMATVRMHRLLFEQRKIDEVGGCWHKISGLPAPKKANPGLVAEIVTDAPVVGGDVSADALTADVPVKRKGGRPKGSRNKPRATVA